MSGRSPLVFRQLNIRRTPGIETPFVVENLTSGINITYGPNASGKSTTAQVLQMLLWNDLPGWQRASLAGRIGLDGSEWIVDIDAGVATTRRDGSDGARLPVDGVDYRDRYILTLHDLLQADNADFASVILRESAGGYDVEAACDLLEYGLVSGRPTNHSRNLRSAQQHVRQMSQEQQRLVQEQQSLSELSDKYHAAQAAVVCVALLEKALVARQRQRELDLARETLQAMPENISRLSGNELERLNELDSRRSEYEQARRQHEAEIQRTETEIEETGLGDVDLPEGFLAALKEKSRQLQEVAGRLERAEAELAGQTRERDQAARQLGRYIEEQQLRVLEADGLRRLVTIARRFERARADYEAAEALRSWLGAPAEHGDIDRLRQGISQLNGWLRSSGAPAETQQGGASWLPALAGSGLIALIAIVSALIGHPLFIGFVVLAAVPIGLALLTRPKAAPTTGRATIYQEEYRRLDLSQPRNWTVEEVDRMVQELSQRLHQQQLAFVRAERWSGLEERWRNADAEYRAAEAEWTDGLQAYGLEPVASSELYVVAQNLDRWQDADARVAAATDEVERERGTRDRLLDEVNRELATVSYSDSLDHASIAGYINDLDERLQRLRSARLTGQNARNTLDGTIQLEVDRIERERKALFESLGLDVGDERTLAEWIEQRPAFLDARRDVEQAELALRHARAELGDDQQLIERSESDLQAELASARLQAEEAERLHRQIIEIETRIEDAKQARNLEDALVAEEHAADVLRGDREEGYRSAAGWTLAEYVRQRTRDRDRPQVFHRAREFFVRMTQGRYVLEFNDDPKPAFRAIDTTTNANHGLDELSSATRVQLLMAVRIAFVEEMEHGPKLPLILDETLGNADEHRAEAIIRAVCEISRSGRQIFYFTAQLDEVAKWRRLLPEHPELPYSVNSLVEARQLAETGHSILEDLPPAPPTVPAPDGTTHLEYREVLRVPQIDPRQDVESVHLWYLIPDPGELHKLLTYGISTWGQLKTLVTYGGGEFVDFEAFEVGRARAVVIGAAIRARRVGHGRLVDRAAVLDSGAFTDTFISRVVREVERAEGDAETLLRRLENGAVTRLRADYIETFHTYLSEEGYLDTEDPLEEGDVRARVLGETAESIASGRITHDEVDFLLRCIPLLSD